MDQAQPGEVHPEAAEAVWLGGMGYFFASNVRYHYCHNLQNSGIVHLEHLATEKIPSDVLTKPLAEEEHKRHSRVLLGHAQIEGV